MIKYTLLLQFWAACLAAWVIVGAGVLVLVTDEDEFAVLGVAILAVAVIAVLTHPVLFAVEIAAVIAAVAFAIVMIARADNQAALDLQDDGILPAAVMAVTLVGAWLLARAYHAAGANVRGELATRSQAIRELSRFDIVTGALEPRFGQQLLTEENERSRRYHHSLSLMLMGIENWTQIVSDRGPDEANRVLRGVVEVMIGILRTTDKVIQHTPSAFALILPETPSAGASILAERLVERLQQDLAISVRIGLAEFPEDAVSVGDLINEAEQALEFARRSQMRVASRALLSQ